MSTSKAAAASAPAQVTAPIPAPKEPDYPGEPIQWAADLVDWLKASRTGNTALEIVRAEMVNRYNDPALSRLPADHPDRHLTAREALAFLEMELPGHTITHDKARQLIETGRIVPAPPTKPAADLLPRPPAGEAPERPLPVAKEMPIAKLGPVDQLPGVHEITADTETVGPKAMPARPSRRGTMKLGS